MKKRGFFAFLISTCVFAMSLSACTTTPIQGEAGPQGEQGVPGETGPQGPAGNDGNDGQDGQDGTSLLTGHGEPQPSYGKEGDSYINLDNWDYYVKTSEGWVLQGNIKGNDGQDGTDGNDGTNGQNGVSIVSIIKTSSDGLVDAYTIYYSNGTTSTFTVTNGAEGSQGIQGNPGQDGHTPEITIGSNGHWYVDGIDTGVSAQGNDGNDGSTPYIGPNNHWWINGEDTGVVAIGQDGSDGEQGVSITSIAKTSSEGNVDTYTITFSNGDTFSYQVTNGTNGTNGKSAYELYCEAHPEYTGTEEEWIDDLINGRLITQYYTVTFDSRGGSTVPSELVLYAGKAHKPNNPTKDGYTFKRWCFEEDGEYHQWLFKAYSVTEDITLYAEWVHQESGGGDVIDPTTGNEYATKHVRYIKNVDGVNQLKTISDVPQDHILTTKPKYIEYYEDEYGNVPEPIDHSDDPTYDFYGMDNGSYIYYDNSNVDSQWKYAEVSADATNPVQDTISLNCFTISYKQTINSVTKTYFLKYQASSNGSYDTLVNEEWNSEEQPQNDEYYFCFKTSFDNHGVSRFTECSGNAEYYIYSPVGQKYLCTYSPQNLASSTVAMNANVLHTPVFVPQEGYEVLTNKYWTPTLFTISGPKTKITYNAVDNKNSGYDRNVNDDFDTNAGRTAAPYKGALQGSNTPEMGLFGGHKMTSDCSGGFFTIGEYIDSQTTTLNNAFNYKLVDDSNQIFEGSTLLFAGHKGEQENDYAIDYAMSTQTTNNRSTVEVHETFENNKYVINDTSSAEKLVINYVDSCTFTLFDGSGYLCYPSTAFAKGSNTANWLRTFDYNVIYEEGHEDRIPYSKWTFEPVIEDGHITKFRLQNVGNPDRYLCYNISANVFSTYSLSAYQTTYEATEFDNNNVDLDPNTGYPNVRCWFYIFMEQNNQTIQNVHYTTAKTVEIADTASYPFKIVETYDLYVSDVENNPTDISKFSLFSISPVYDVEFNLNTSTLTYLESENYSNSLVWKRVDDISELHDGDSIMFGSKTTYQSQHCFMGSESPYYRHKSSNVTFTDPYLFREMVPLDASQFTLISCEKGWRFDSGEGFLSSVSSSQNYLKTISVPDSNGNSDWNIIILTDGTANVVSQGNYTRNKIQSASYGAFRYFSCFSQTQTSISIYKLTYVDRNSLS